MLDSSPTIVCSSPWFEDAAPSSAAPIPLVRPLRPLPEPEAPSTATTQGVIIGVILAALCAASLLGVSYATRMNATATATATGEREAAIFIQPATRAP
jgi:hypothetical protein